MSTTLNRICDMSEKTISEKIEDNLIFLFDWGFIDKGAIQDVNVADSGCYVDDRSRLTLVDDPRFSFTGDQAWQGPQNWVHESGMANGDGNYPPVIYVDDVVTAPTRINYRTGTVYFNPAISGSAKVQAEFSYKWINVMSADELPHIRRIDYDHLRTDKSSNERSRVPPEIRVELPVVAVEVPPIGSWTHFAFGGSKAYRHDIKFHIIGNSRSEAKRIADAIALQGGSVFHMFDPEAAFTAGDFPLNYDGTVNANVNFPELTQLYPMGSIYFEATAAQNGNFLSQNLYSTMVSVTSKIINCYC